jgi:hypothetical protein
LSIAAGYYAERIGDIMEDSQRGWDSLCELGRVLQESQIAPGVSMAQEKINEDTDNKVASWQVKHL